MQPYDLAMIAVLAGATLLGFLKGMARQVASLVSIGASYFLALHLSPSVAAQIHQPEPLNRFLAMLLIYLVTSLVIWLVFRKVSQAIERVQLKEFDRQVGALFGAAKGLLLCVAITFFAVSLSAASRQTVLASRSGNYIAGLIHQAGPIMPKEFHAMLDKYLNDLEQQLTPLRTQMPRDVEQAPGYPIARDFNRPG
jgi:membrane protein required for colicin V production